MMGIEPEEEIEVVHIPPPCLFIYVAGKMSWIDSEDSEWIPSTLRITSCSTKRRIKELEETFNIRFIFPDEVFFDHGGDRIEGIVGRDISLIDRCDGVVALFTHKIQVGTMVEVFHALRRGKEVLVLFSDELLQPAGSEVSSTTKDYLPIKKPLFMRGESNHYWFLINYLLLYSSQWVSIYVVKDLDGVVLSLIHI